MSFSLVPKVGHEVGSVGIKFEIKGTLGGVKFHNGIIV